MLADEPPDEADDLDDSVEELVLVELAGAESELFESVAVRPFDFDRESLR